MSDMAKPGVELKKTNLYHWDRVTESLIEVFAESTPFVNVIYILAKKLKE